MFGLRDNIWWVIVIWLGLLLSIRLKVIHDENAAYGIVWGGWRKGYYHVEAENMTTPPPPNYYKMINVKPGAPMQYVQRRCDERIATMAAKKKLTEEENARLRDITDGCRILTVDYERCYYDARKQLRDGLWEGYVEECLYLEEVGKKQERMDRMMEVWFAQGLEGAALEARIQGHIKADDRVIKSTRKMTDEALIQARIKRQESDERKKERERQTENEA